MSKFFNKLVFFALFMLLSACNQSQLILKQAHTYEHLKQYQKAADTYKTYIHSNPSNSSAYASLGHCEYHLNEYDKAIEHLTLAIKFDAGNAYAFDLRGLCKYKQKLYKEALIDYKTSVKLQPNNILAYRDMADCARHLKNPVLANQYDSQADKLDKSAPKHKVIIKKQIGV